MDKAILRDIVIVLAIVVLTIVVCLSKPAISIRIKLTEKIEIDIKKERRK